MPINYYLIHLPPNTRINRHWQIIHTSAPLQCGRKLELMGKSVQSPENGDNLTVSTQGWDWIWTARSMCPHHYLLYHRATLSAHQQPPHPHPPNYTTCAALFQRKFNMCPWGDMAWLHSFTVVLLKLSMAIGIDCWDKTALHSICALGSQFGINNKAAIELQTRCSQKEHNGSLQWLTTHGVEFWWMHKECTKNMVVSWLHLYQYLNEYKINVDNLQIVAVTYSRMQFTQEYLKCMHFYKNDLLSDRNLANDWLDSIASTR